MQNFNPARLQVTSRRGNRVSAKNDRIMLTRNISHFKKIRENDQRTEESDDDSDGEMYGERGEVRPGPERGQEGDAVKLRRSARRKVQIERYGNVFPTCTVK